MKLPHRSALILASTLALGLVTDPALAQSAQDSIVAQLSQQGFRNITVSRTFLGRTRILATSNDLRREIVFNPTTGEILRDYWEDLDDDEDDESPRLINPAGGSGDEEDDDDERSDNSGPGNANDDDEDDDDEDEDEDEDDEDDEDDDDDED